MTTTDEIIRVKDVPKVVGMSIPTIWRLRRDGEFPKAVRLSRKCVGFLRSDLERWLRERQGGD